MLTVVLLAVAAAFLFAVAANCQQRAASRSAAARVAKHPAAAHAWLPGLSLIGHLVRDRLWLTGWCTNLAGFLTQALALHLGSVLVVQPLLVTQLLFALPLAAASSGRRPAARDWLGGALVCGGLATLLSVRGAAPLEGDAERGQLVLAAVLTAGLAVGVITVARGRAPAVRAALVGLSAGMLFALSAVFTKLTATDLVDRGVAGTAQDWPGYALAASTVAGLLLEQDAFAAGPLPTALTAMTVMNPIASYAIGVMAFNVPAPTDPAALAGIAGSGLLLALGIAVLAHSPLVRPQRGGGPAGDVEEAHDVAVP